MCPVYIHPWLKSIVEHGNDCWKALTYLLKQKTSSYIHLFHLFVSYEVFWCLWMRFQLSEAIFRHGKILLKKFNIFQFQHFRFRNWRVPSCDVRTQSWAHCPNFMDIEWVYDIGRQCWRSLTVRHSFFGCNPPLPHTGPVRNHFSNLARHCAWFKR